MRVAVRGTAGTFPRRRAETSDSARPRAPRGIALSRPARAPTFSRPPFTSRFRTVPMQIIREPRVTVLARQQFVYPEHINWESDSEVAGEVVAEFAGRLCYLSFGEDAGMEGGHKTIQGRTSNESYLGNILQVKHGSVLEHA